MRTCISDGNSKLGDIPNISLRPGRDCGDVPCKKDCYALKAYRAYPSARKAWQDNARSVRSNPEAYFGAIRAYLAKNEPSFFRWHVAGDFLDQSYLENVQAIASEFPSIKFLAFTKRHDLDFAQSPANLAIVFSMWPGWGDEAKARALGLPIAWMDDGTEHRIPANAIECPGNCESCGMCWNLKSIGRDVRFEKH